MIFPPISCRATASPCLALLALSATGSLLSTPAHAGDGLTGPVSQAWATLNDSSATIDSGSAIAVDQSGDVFVTGHYRTATNQDDFYTAKYAAATGALLWFKTYNGPNNGGDSATAIAVDSAGNAIVTGNSYNGSGDSDIYTVKYAAQSGEILWQKRHDGPAHAMDAVHALKLDPSDNVLIAGSSTDATGKEGYYMAKYSSTDGTLIWARQYNDSVDPEFYDEIWDMDCDAAGNLIVSGLINQNDYDSTESVYTAKYAAADGALLWGRHSDRLLLMDLTVDNSGNALITAYTSIQAGGPNQGYVAKYAAADGSIIWEKPNTRPIYATAADANGDVFIVGTPPTGDQGYYTAKLAAGTGELIWEKGLAADPAGDAASKIIAVDVNGNVVVNGRYVTPSSYAIRTVAYSGGDGTFLWEHGYGLPGGLAQANAMTLDGEGNVVLTGSQASGTNTKFLTYKIQTGLPEIAVELADGTALADGTDSLGFGSVTVGESPVKTLTIRNQGTANLKHLSATIDGLGSAAYSITAPLPQSLEPGAGAQITIRFAPDADAAFPATLHLASNDLDEDSFELSLGGVGAAPAESLLTAWRQSHFGTTLNTGTAANDADSDKDGIPNSLEFISGTNPAAANAFPQSVLPDDSSHFIFRFSRADSSEFPGVTLAVQSSSDLQSWPLSYTIGADTASSSPGVTVEENGSDPDTVSVRIPRSSAGTEFARIHVTLAP